MTVQEGLASLADSEEKAFRNMRNALSRWYQFGGKYLCGIEWAIEAKDPGRIKGEVCACFRADESGAINVVNPWGELAAILRIIRNQAQVVENYRRLRQKIQNKQGE